MWLPPLLSKDGLGLLPYSSPLGIIAAGDIGTFSGPAFVMTGMPLQAIAA